MADQFPAHMASSPAVQFVQRQGWEWRGGDGGQFQIETCPFCKKADYKFYIAWMNPEEGTKDGLYFCHHGSCQKTGNLRTLAEYVGERVAGVDSRSEWAGKGDKKQDALPDVAVCHAALLGDAEALDYLENVRGFTREVIEKYKLGLKEKIYFREAGEVRALVIPYLVNGNVIYTKYRTLPPSPKDFVTPSGWEAPLYNGEILQPGLHEIIFVEGEADALSCLSNGVMNVVGVPGAGMKKASWIDALDKVAPEKIYILYDNDKAGAKGSQELASRIGIERVWKLKLPQFTIYDTTCDKCKGTGLATTEDAGTVIHAVCSCGRPGKDVNEWFRYGNGSLEAFEKVKADAELFDVSGVTSSKDALEQLEDELNGKVDLAPKYVSGWPSLNALVGFEDGDVIDILAPEKIGKTTFGMNLMDHMCSAYGEDGLIVCLEMTQARLARRWVAMVTGFEDKMVQPNTEEAKDALIKLKEAVVVARETQQNRGADLYFAYPQGWQDNPDSIFKLIKDCIRRYGVKWVMFDNLQKFCDESLGKAHGHRTIYLSQLSKKFASIAKDHRIKLIRILQPRQIEDGQMIQSRHVDGSSQVLKDCDCMMTLWRSQLGVIKKSQWEQDGFAETKVSFDPKMKVAVSLSRYSSGGECALWFDGARSQVKEYTKEMSSGPKTEFNTIIATEAPSIPVQAAAPIPVAQEAISI